MESWKVTRGKSSCVSSRLEKERQLRRESGEIIRKCLTQLGEEEPEEARGRGSLLIDESAKSLHSSQHGALDK
jgi:hypothetical protein